MPRRIKQRAEKLRREGAKPLPLAAQQKLDARFPPTTEEPKTEVYTNAVGKKFVRKVFRGGKRWKKGETPNPDGRPTNVQSLTTILRSLGEEDGYLRYRKLAQTVWRIALSGEEWAAKHVWDRIEGRAILRVVAQEGDITVGLPVGLTQEDL